MSIKEKMKKLAIKQALQKNKKPYQKKLKKKKNKWVLRQNLPNNSKILELWSPYLYVYRCTLKKVNGKLPTKMGNNFCIQWLQDWRKICRKYLLQSFKVDSTVLSLKKRRKLSNLHWITSDHMWAMKMKCRLKKN